MKKIRWFIVMAIVILVDLMLLNACKPVKNMTSSPAAWSGETYIKRQPLKYDAAKKTVFIIADQKMTELFDMMAPYYLFNETGKANVYLVAKDNVPVLVRKDLFANPQLTFKDIDSLHLKPDVIVIPALSVRNNFQDSSLIDWIKKCYQPSVKVLAVCDGAATAAATGFYDGKFITCHASDFAGIRAHFKNPLWVQNVSVTKSDNLYSTAGVSNAVEGSLTVIEDMFGRTVMLKLLDSIHYPYNDIKLDHKSVGVNGRHKMTAFKKILFRKNRNLGVLIENGVNEFELASILDTYGRTFPTSLATYIRNDSTVKTKYGLSLIFTGKNNMEDLDELHVLMPGTFSKDDKSVFKDVKIISYDELKSDYPINICLKRIGEQYGQAFQQLVKVSLDYN